MIPRPLPSNRPGPYHRPNLGLWHAWFWAHDARHAVQAVNLTAVAWGLTAAYAGLKAWRELTREPP